MSISAISPIHIFQPAADISAVKAREKLGDTETATATRDRVSLGTVNVPVIKRVDRNPNFEFSGGGTDFNSDPNLQSTQAVLAVEEQGSFQQPRSAKKNDKPASEPGFVFVDDKNNILSFVKPESKTNIPIGAQSFLPNPIDDGFQIAVAAA